MYCSQTPSLHCARFCNNSWRDGGFTRSHSLRVLHQILSLLPVKNNNFEEKSDVFSQSDATKFASLKFSMRQCVNYIEGLKTVPFVYVCSVHSINIRSMMILDNT